MRERCMSGSVRGARGNLRPYRDRAIREGATNSDVNGRAVPTRRGVRPERYGVRNGWGIMQSCSRGHGAQTAIGVCRDFTDCAP